MEVAASDFVPGRINATNAFRPEGVPGTENYIIASGRVSHEFLETLGIELVAGRTFSRSYSTDAENATVINEAAAKELGWTPAEALGKRIAELAAGENNEDIYRTIVGVTEDFHFESLHQAIRPLALNIQESNFSRASIRVHSEDLPATLDFIKEQWEGYESEFLFSSIFLNDDFNRFYEQEQRLSRIFIVFTILAIIIACMGLFGLASFIAQRRSKEIGLRKVLGASVPGLVVMLSNEFTRLVLIASLIALPTAYLGMNYWLQSFAYQTEIAWWLFIAATGTALVIAWITVSYQSIRAALANPVDTLKMS